MGLSVKVSSKNQIVIPREAREKLRIRPGQNMLVLCREDRVVLIPKPKNFSKALSGLHKEIWENIDADDYLEEERNNW